MTKLFPLFFFATFAGGCSLEYDACETEDVGTDVASDTRPEPCPEGKLCLDMTPIDGGAIRAGHLAVVWSQLDQTDPDPQPEIAFTRSFGPRDRHMEIDISSIRAPSRQELLLCERACDDEAACACRSETKIGVATVVVADDVDRDGRLELDEIGRATYGLGHLLIAHSETEQMISPPPFDGVFSNGFTRGVAAYRFIGNPEERVARAERGERFELNLCREAGDSCELPFPELRGF
jgi:hypothetical protein